MAQQKASDRMNELIHSLQQAMGRLEQGKLGLPELEQCTEDARAIYERMVVLRHKAREAHINSAKRQQAPMPPLPSPPAADAGEPDPELLSIRLDTRPPEPAHHQTSLLDAITETENGAETKPAPGASPSAAPPKVKPPKVKKPEEPKERPVSVADKMEHAPVADLRKAIALSQKFWFVAELFGGERDRYEKAIDALNGMESLAEAEAYLREEVTAKQAKAPGEEVATTFMELIQRRFR